MNKLTNPGLTTIDQLPVHTHLNNSRLNHKRQISPPSTPSFLVLPYINTCTIDITQLLLYNLKFIDCILHVFRKRL